MQISIIGIGRLGTVFARAFARNNEIILFDRDYKKAKEVATELGALAVDDYSKTLTCEMIVITVKPSQIEEVIPKVKEASLLVCCAAGIPIKKLEKHGAKRVIRIMPNICADVGEAVIAYALHPESEKQEKIFLTVFTALGTCIKTDESHLDAITAVSGSGPAFLAFVAEAMIDEAANQGLDKEISKKIVAQTLIGTGKLLLCDEWSTKKIIENVASPGGTTEAGLKMLEQKSTKKAIVEAIRFATEKAKELGKA